MKTNYEILAVTKTNVKMLNNYIFYNKFPKDYIIENINYYNFEMVVLKKTKEVLHYSILEENKLM